jgi:hypothetical protein
MYKFGLAALRSAISKTLLGNASPLHSGGDRSLSGLQLKD